MSRILEALRQAERELGPSVHRDVYAAAAHVLLQRPDVSPTSPDNGAVLVARVQADPRLVSLTDPAGFGAEKFRVLAARLAHSRGEQKVRSVQITSSVAGDGKSLVAANLALALARWPNSTVLLLEGDLRRPALSSIFGVPTTTGVADWFESGAKCVDAYLRRIEGTQLWFLPAGSAQHSTELLQSEAIRELLVALKKRFDWIVVDTPPMLPMADANLWARLVDGTLLVVRAGKTPRKALEEGLRALDNPNLLGVVLNDVLERESAHYYGTGKDQRSGCVVMEEGKQT